MMSSEEETEFGLYADKLLKKTKRTRQRVDAGEPRNSYSSIPNFSSRPTFLGGTGAPHPYAGAFFAAQQQQLGLFGPAGGFAPAKMLNELLDRHQRAAAAGAGDDDTKFDAGAGGCTPPPSGGAAADHPLAHHMLRDILQNHKLDLERNGHDHILNNNNNNNDDPKTSPGGGRGSPDGSDKDQNGGGTGKSATPDDAASVTDDVANGMDCSADSLPNSPKQEPASPPAARAEDVKRARVEHIVSGMRASPAPPQVNGCKKRKLYQPQQHDTNADRYLDDEEEETEPSLRQKREEKVLLESQLRTMQEQLADLQQKYMHLCTTKVGHGSEESQEIEEIPSDSDSLKRSGPPSPVTTSTPTPVQQHRDAHLAHEVSAKLKMAAGGPAAVAAAAAFHNGLLHAPPHMSSAAAMYLGVSHKFFLEQEARLAKEAAAAAAMAGEPPTTPHRPPQPHTPHKHPPPSQQQQQQDERAISMHGMASRPPGPPQPPPPSPDLEGLADALKTEITASLAGLIDQVLSRFLYQKRCKQQDAAAAAAAAEQLNKDLLMASQLLDRKSPRTKVAERPGQPGQPGGMPTHMVNGGAGCPTMVPVHNHVMKPSDLHVRPPMFQPPKPPGISQAPLYGMNHPFCVSKQQADTPEQNEALSLVVAPKKKRHKVTDTRITPRTVSRILGGGAAPGEQQPQVPTSGAEAPPGSGGPCQSPRPPPMHGSMPGGPPQPSAPYGHGGGGPQPHAPPPMLPVSLPTSVAIPNPGLHESQVFSPYSPFFHAAGAAGHNHHMAMQASSSPPRMHKMERDSPPAHHPPTLLHPALLAAAQGHHAAAGSEYAHLRAAAAAAAAGAQALAMDAADRGSDCASAADASYDGMQPTSSTLTPMHLRKAKLMFFWVRYPSSAVLKMYFPDIKFNKNNTAQLVKWFSNFREFYYIQMEKYARQAVSEGVKNADDLHVGADSELYRVLNLHYNRNNHIEVPSNFRFVVEQTLREFFKAIQEGRDAEQSWKKSIYKIISRLDDPVPEYFKSPNFLEQLE